MNGVTIIAEHLCREIELDAFLTLGIFYTILCMACCIFLIFVYKPTVTKFNIIFCVIICIVCGAVWCIMGNRYNTTHMEYTVIIDESVSFIDFVNRYEIVGSDYPEYRVIDKSNNQ